MSAIILDVDTGVDDACALLFAARHPGLDLRAVTCVGGNAGLDAVVANTLTVLDVCGRGDVPVAAGARRPLIAEPVDARHVHGADGMADLALPKSTRSPVPEHAVELLRDLLLSTPEPITLIPLGPLTNIALLLRTYPEVATGLARIVFMGGAAGAGNATASAEFNIFHDPEAAAIMLDACADLQIAVTMYGLDVFTQPVVAASTIAELARSPLNTPTGLAGGLLSFACQRWGGVAAGIGDAGAVVSVAQPQLLGTQVHGVRVELAGAYSRGRTIVDTRDWSGDMDFDPHGPAPAKVDVGLQIDADAVVDQWLRTVTSEG